MPSTRLPISISLAADVEYLTNRPTPYRARVRWTDPNTGRRRSLSTSHNTPDEANAWANDMRKAAAGGVDPTAATMTLTEYGDLNMQLALRGLEDKTTDPYLAGWKLRVVPTLGHLPIRMITNGAVDRAVHSWIADECGKSTVKNSLAMLVRVMEQALRDGIIERNPARITGWQREYLRAEDELDDPRSLALPNWSALTRLAAALVANASGDHAVWGDVVIFAACTAARIGEVSGCRVKDISTTDWTWTAPPDHPRAGRSGRQRIQRQAGSRRTTNP